MAFFNDKTLLIIDDRRVTRTSWQYQSSTWGFQKTLVLSIQKALDYIKQNPNQVDVIMIDVDRPQAKVNPGLVLLEQIRAIPYDTSAPDAPRELKPVPCVLVSYHRRSHPDLNSLSPMAKSSVGSSPVSPTAPMAPSVKGAHPSNNNKSHSDVAPDTKTSATKATCTSTHDNNTHDDHTRCYGNATCTPNTMNSSMLVVKTWGSREERSPSFSKCPSPSFHPPAGHPSGADADPSVGHLIKPVKQSKLLPMFHGLMTGSWPLASSVVPDHDHREDDRKQQLQALDCLLVDDNPVNQKVIARILGRMGIVPELANNGQEAVDKVRARAEAAKAHAGRGGGGEPGSGSEDKKSKQYDIIFMDIWMPIMSGLEATTEIRTNVLDVTDKEPFIIAMTACVMVGDREKCLASGMNEYISKPVRKEELCAILDRWLDERARVERERTLQSQRKLIQKKKRDMLKKRSLAILTGVRAGGGGGQEPSLESAGVDQTHWHGEEDEDEDEDEDDEDEDDEDGEVEDDEVMEEGHLSDDTGHGIDSRSIETVKERKKKSRKSRRNTLENGMFSDSEGVLGCCGGGGGGLKLVSVGARLDRVTSHATVDTVDTMETMETMHTTSDSFHTARTHPMHSGASSSRNSVRSVLFSDSSSTGTIRGLRPNSQSS